MGKKKNECVACDYTSPLERPCGRVEYAMRRCYSSLLYYGIHRGFHPNHPFFNPNAIKAIEKLVGRDTKVFEWGSGASTIWFARRVGSIISVEHDKAWHEKGVAKLKEEKLFNAEIIFLPPQDVPEGHCWSTDWKHFAALGHAPTKPDFKAYFEAIDKYPDGYFDIIIIDGRERVGCALHAVPKLSKDGVIILDDSARPRYGEIFKLLKDREAKIYDYGLMQTTLFLSKD